ncbi:MAG: MFS transporter [Alphaproteobacteria bacterium]|nr:MFS transporter [Alphaproteobacteria bacterium]
MQTASRHSNAVLYKLLIIQAFYMAMFLIPVIVAYFQLRGVSLAGFLLIQGLFRFMVVACEIPTGYIADRWHRNRVIILALAFWLAGNVVFIVAYGFTWLLVGELLFAIASALLSGTLEAYIYDILEQQKRTNEAEKWSSRLHASSYATESFMGIAGALLFVWWTAAPAIAQAVAGAIALGLACTLPNVPRKKKDLSHSHWQEVRRIVKWSLHGHPELKWLILFPALLFSGSIVFFWGIQAMLAEKGVSAVWIGWAISVNFMFKTVFALATEKLLKKYGAVRFITLLLMLFAVGGTLLAMSPNPWWLYFGGVMSAGLVHAMGRPVFNAFINRRTESDERATVLSVMGFISMLLGGFWLTAAQPLMGYANISMGHYILLTVVITLLLMLWPAVRLYQLRLLEPVSKNE